MTLVSCTPAYIFCTKTCTYHKHMLQELWVLDPLTKIWTSSREACGYFAPARYWAASGPTFVGGHYRCPRCGARYAPWVQGSKYVPANKILVVEAAITVDNCSTQRHVIFRMLHFIHHAFCILL